MKNVLITGVAGFVGSNLANSLIKKGGYRVVGIDNLSYGVREQIPEGVEFLNLDIRSKDIYPHFENIDYVFHFAAKNCISDCQKDPLETSDINITGTINIFEAAKIHHVKKVIYAESSALYEGSKNFPTSENDEHPESFYALSKYASMFFADAYDKFYGVKSTALRYFNVYGPRQDYRRSIPPLFSALIINLLKGKQPTIYGDGTKRRDFIYVDDINEFHILCMEDDRTTGEVFNLGSGVNHSVNDIFEVVANLVGTDIKPNYQNDLPGEAFQNLANISKAQSLGWNPTTDLKHGMKESVDYIRKEIEAGRV
ncbi:MAG: NAD-dependent epimerase/dehydratase family protein [Mucilaginibacter sp.]